MQCAHARPHSRPPRYCDPFFSLHSENRNERKREKRRAIFHSTVDDQTTAVVNDATLRQLIDKRRRYIESLVELHQAESEAPRISRRSNRHCWWHREVHNIRSTTTQTQPFAKSRWSTLPCATTSCATFVRVCGGPLRQSGCKTCLAMAVSLFKLRTRSASPAASKDQKNAHSRYNFAVFCPIVAWKSLTELVLLNDSSSAMVLNLQNRNTRAPSRGLPP